MNLQSIRESYSKLLDTFKTAGIKLNESQKSDLDTFVLALESKMSEQRKMTIEKTKKLVEEKLEREYRGVFESVMEHMRENAALAAKIQDVTTKLNERKEVAQKVNDYLDLYVESVLPKKAIVDYDRMQKLEKIQESLRSALLVSEDAVEDKIQQLEESYGKKDKDHESELALLTAKLNESIKQNAALKRQVGKFKAAELLESKVKDLPTYEARRVKRVLAESTEAEINRNFDRILAGVRSQIKEAQKPDIKTIESEIDEIVGGKKAVKEDDLLKNRPHNLHKSVDEEVEDVKEDDLLKNRSHNLHKSVDENDKFETIEEVDFDENGDVQLDESDVIDHKLMDLWCRQAETQY